MQFRVTGMTCEACSARVEKAVSSVNGVEKCSVNLLTNTMDVKGAVTAEAVIAAVVRAGYGATSTEQDNTQHHAVVDDGTRPSYGDKPAFLH